MPRNKGSDDDERNGGQKEQGIAASSSFTGRQQVTLSPASSNEAATSTTTQDSASKQPKNRNIPRVSPQGQRPSSPVASSSFLGKRKDREQDDLEEASDLPPLFPNLRGLSAAAAKVRRDRSSHGGGRSTIPRLLPAYTSNAKVDEEVLTLALALACQEDDANKKPRVHVIPPK